MFTTVRQFVSKLADPLGSMPGKILAVFMSFVLAFTLCGLYNPVSAFAGPGGQGAGYQGKNHYNQTSTEDASYVSGSGNQDPGSSQPGNDSEAPSVSGSLDTNSDNSSATETETNSTTEIKGASEGEIATTTLNEEGEDASSAVQSEENVESKTLSVSDLNCSTSGHQKTTIKAGSAENSILYYVVLDVQAGTSTGLKELTSSGVTVCNSENKDHVVLVFAKPASEYLLTGFGASNGTNYYSTGTAFESTNIALGSGSTTNTSDNLRLGHNDFVAAAKSAVEQAKSDGFVGYLGYTLKQDRKSDTIEITAASQTPSLSATLTVEKGTTTITDGSSLNVGDSVNIKAAPTTKTQAGSGSNVVDVKVVYEKINSIKINGKELDSTQYKINSDGSVTISSYQLSLADVQEGKFEVSIQAEAAYSYEITFTNDHADSTTATSSSTLTAESTQSFVFAKRELSYNANTGKSDLDTEIAKKYEFPETTSAYAGTTAQVMSTVPERDGYYFTGWNTKPDGTGKTYSANDPVTIPSEENLVLYAQWSKKHEVTITANSDTVTYNEEPQLVSGLQGADENGVVSVKVEGQEYKISGLSASATGTIVGTYSAEVTGTAQVTNAAGQDVTAQFAVKTENGTLTINPGTYSVTAKGYEGKYDGKVHGITFVENLPEGATVTYTAKGKDSDNKFSDITNGEVTVNYTIKCANYKDVTGSATVKITPREVTLTSASASKTYDGTALTNNNVTVGGDGFVSGQGVTCTFKASASQTNVGSTTNAFDYKFNDGTAFTNYTIKTKEGTLTVNPAPLTVTTPTTSKTYDGIALTAAGTLTGLVNGETATLITTGTQTEVGNSSNTYKITWGTALQGNYTVNENLGTLTVNPSTSTEPDNGNGDNNPGNNGEDPDNGNGGNGGPTDPDNDNNQGETPSDNNNGENGGDNPGGTNPGEGGENPVDPGNGGNGEETPSNPGNGENGETPDNGDNGAQEGENNGTDPGNNPGQDEGNNGVENPDTGNGNDNNAGEENEGNEPGAGDEADDGNIVEPGAAIAPGVAEVINGILAATPAAVAAGAGAANAVDAGADTATDAATGTTITDDATPMAANAGTEISDDENPLAGSAHEPCWVHTLMFLGMILTALYGFMVVGRRSNFTRRVNNVENGFFN